MEITLVKAAGPGEQDRAWLTAGGVARRGPVQVTHDLPHLVVESLFGITDGLRAELAAGSHAAAGRAATARDPKRRKQGRIVSGAATGALILRSGTGPTVRSSSGPAKIVCEDVPAPPATAIGSDERGSAREVARCSGPSGGGAKRSWSWLPGASWTSSGGAKKTCWKHHYTAADLARAAEVRRQALRGDPPTDGLNPGDAPALYRLARTHSTARTTSQKTSVLTAPHLLRLACHQIAAPNTTRTRTTPTPPSSLMPQKHASLLGLGTGSMLSRKTQRKRNGLPCPACGGAQGAQSVRISVRL
jgi:hypothetical protein